MNLEPQSFSTRDKLILAGLYLSKYDTAGVRRLGFGGFKEACNVVGYALGSKPASVKNYRDEFDPLFPNPRQGWHKRPRRAYCLNFFEQYKDLDFETFTALIKSFVGCDESALSEIIPKDKTGDSASLFANRLMTGLAAEQYFESVQPSLPEFKGFARENTTRLGCGYDYRLCGGGIQDFLAVEVKGLRARVGSVALTPKEHDVAGILSERFFLFVVKNFQESPFHEIYQNPLCGPLAFAKTERVLVQVSWSTSV
jgi:hypothetical protein